MKTKVIAFRVNAEEHEALYFAARTKQVTMGELVYMMVSQFVPEAQAELNKERKRLDAKAKREAKKAAANGLQ